MLLQNVNRLKSGRQITKIRTHVDGHLNNQRRDRRLVSIWWKTCYKKHDARKRENVIIIKLGRLSLTFNVLKMLLELLIE